jgi:hypothetical protein
MRKTGWGRSAWAAAAVGVALGCGGAAAQVAAPVKPAVASVKVQGAEKPATTAKAKRSAPVVGSLGPELPPIAFRPESGLVQWYAERGDVIFPTRDRLPFCHAYECTLRAIVRVTDEDRAELRAIFANRSHSAEAEREGIDLAVSWFEKRAQPLLGGPPDVRGSDLAHSGQPGQTDCLDEATNSTTLLIFLQEEGLLRYHTVRRPTSRGGLLLTLAHATAVFTDRDGKDWVVDSWMRDMGDPNDVMPLEQWESQVF